MKPTGGQWKLKGPWGSWAVVTLLACYSGVFSAMGPGWERRSVSDGGYRLARPGPSRTPPWKPGSWALHVYTPDAAREPNVLLKAFGRRGM